MQMNLAVGLLARFVVPITVVELGVHYLQCVEQLLGHLGTHPRAFSWSASSQIVGFEPLFSYKLALVWLRFHQKCSQATFHVV